MANFNNISQAYYTQFMSDVYMLARQKISKYLPLVDVVEVGGKPGERAVFQRMAEINFSEINDRYQELEGNTVDKSARSLTFRKYHAHITLDKIDDMKMIYDPSGPYVETLAAAYAKKVDDLIREALIGSADNKDGTSSTAATAATDLATIEIGELLAIRQSFNDAYVDSNEPVYVMIDGSGWADIMALNQVISSDFNKAMPLERGAIGQFLGMQFMYDANMPLYTNGTSHQLIAFTRKSLKVALPQSLDISIDRIAERRNATLIQAEFTFGAVRMEENQVRHHYLTA